MRIPQRTAAAALALACTIGIAACGGDNKGGGVLGAGTTAATTAASAATTTGSGASASSNGGGTATTAGSTASSGSSASSAPDASTTTPSFSGKGSGDLCGYAKQIEDSQNLDNLFSGDNPNLKDAYAKLDDVFDKAVDKSPAEIKPDMQTLQKGFKALENVLAKYDYDIAKMTQAAASDPSVTQQLQNFDTPEFEAASGRVDAYFTNVCGIKDTSTT
jgi:hypothetical protein